MGKFGSAVKEAGEGLNWLLVIGFLGIVWLMIFGNLSGNLGFTAGSQGYNDTEQVIANITSGTRSFYAFTPTLFVIIGIILLITILLALLGTVMKVMGAGKSKGGFASSSY